MCADDRKAWWTSIEVVRSGVTGPLCHGRRWVHCVAVHSARSASSPWVLFYRRGRPTDTRTDRPSSTTSCSQSTHLLGARPSGTLISSRCCTEHVSCLRVLTVESCVRAYTPRAIVAATIAATIAPCIRPIMNGTALPAVGQCVLMYKRARIKACPHLFPKQDNLYPETGYFVFVSGYKISVSGDKVSVSGYKLSCFGNKCGQAIRNCVLNTPSGVYSTCLDIQGKSSVPHSAMKNFVDYPNTLCID